jgi:hypothetical protein
MGTVTTRLLVLVLGALALTACRLDVTVDVDLGADGTGTVTVTAVADADVVAQVPGLADALVFDDAVNAGWTLDGPTPTPEGGLRVTLTHPVSSPEELANVLDSLGPPFTDMAVGRTTVDDQTTNAIQGTLVLPSGFDSFADADLVAAVGGTPFGDQLAASGATPTGNMSVTFRAALPGELVASTGEEVEPGVREWVAALGGSSTELRLETVQRPEPTGGSWARPLANVALIALIAWVVASVAFVTWVVIARRRRARRRRRRPAMR